MHLPNSFLILSATGLSLYPMFVCTACLIPNLLESTLDKEEIYYEAVWPASKKGR